MLPYHDFFWTWYQLLIYKLQFKRWIFLILHLNSVYSAFDTLFNPRRSIRSVVINFGSDCEEDWAKAQADAIAEYKENNGDVDVRGARFVRLCFI